MLQSHHPVGNNGTLIAIIIRPGSGSFPFGGSGFCCHYLSDCWCFISQLLTSEEGLMFISILNILFALVYNPISEMLNGVARIIPNILNRNHTFLQSSDWYQWGNKKSFVLRVKFLTFYMQLNYKFYVWSLHKMKLCYSLYYI